MNLNFDLRQTLGGIVCLLAADFLLMLDSAVTGWIALALFMIGLFVCWAGLSRLQRTKKRIERSAGIGRDRGVIFGGCKK